MVRQVIDAGEAICDPMDPDFGGRSVPPSQKVDRQRIHRRFHSTRATLIAQRF
jgi:hypothetical protein